MVSNPASCRLGERGLCLMPVSCRQREKDHGALPPTTKSIFSKHLFHPINSCVFFPSPGYCLEGNVELLSNTKCLYEGWILFSTSPYRFFCTSYLEIKVGLWQLVCTQLSLAATISKNSGTQRESIPLGIGQARWVRYSLSTLRLKAMPATKHRLQPTLGARKQRSAEQSRSDLC